MATLHLGSESYATDGVNGTVGIGTTSPQAMLDVGGSMCISNGAGAELYSIENINISGGVTLNGQKVPAYCTAFISNGGNLIKVIPTTSNAAAGPTSADIQAAINYAAYITQNMGGANGHGGIVFLPVGTYTLNEMITVYPSIRLEGSGMWTTALQFSSKVTGPYTAIDVQSWAQVSKLQILPAASATVVSGSVGIQFDNISGSECTIVSEVYIQYMDTGIYDPFWDNYIRDCKIEYCNIGVNLSKPDDIANNITVSDCFFGSNQTAINIIGGYNRVINCHFGAYVGVSAGSIGVWLQEGSIGVAGYTANYISLNDFEGSQTHIQLETNGAIITGNWFNLNVNNTGGLPITAINYVSGADAPDSGNVVSGNSIATSATNLAFANYVLSNFGIWTTNPASNLSIAGNSSIGADYAATAAPQNGLIVEGSVGIGTTNPSWALQVANGQLCVTPESGSPGVVTILPSNDGAWWNIANTNGGGHLSFAIGNMQGANDTTSWASSVLTLLANGLVGIGTTNPCSTLDVENGKLVVQTTHSSYGQVQVLNNGTSSTDTEASMAFAAGVTGGQGGTIQCPTSNLWMLGAGSYSNPSTVFGIANVGFGGYILAANSSGRVGIGTTNPGSSLSIKGAGTTSSTSSLNVTDSSSNSHLFVRDDGNVGIGTASPASKLEDTGAITLDPTTTPASPSQSAEGRIYVKSNKLVIQYNDGGTIRYKYLSLSGTGVTWVATTTAP